MIKTLFSQRRKRFIDCIAACLQMTWWSISLTELITAWNVSPDWLIFGTAASQVSVHMRVTAKVFVKVDQIHRRVQTHTDTHRVPGLSPCPFPLQPMVFPLGWDSASSLPLLPSGVLPPGICQGSCLSSPHCTAPRYARPAHSIHSYTHTLVIKRESKKGKVSIGAKIWLKVFIRLTFFFHPKPSVFMYLSLLNNIHWVVFFFILIDTLVQ